MGFKGNKAISLYPTTFMFSCLLLTTMFFFCVGVAKAEVCVDSLIPGLEAPQPQRHSGQPDRIAASMPGQHSGPQMKNNYNL